MCRKRVRRDCAVDVGFSCSSRGGRCRYTAPDSSPRNAFTNSLFRQVRAFALTPERLLNKIATPPENGWCFLLDRSPRARQALSLALAHRPSSVPSGRLRLSRTRPLSGPKAGSYVSHQTRNGVEGECRPRVARRESQADFGNRPAAALRKAPYFGNNGQRRTVKYASKAAIIHRGIRIILAVRSISSTALISRQMRQNMRCPHRQW
jgi:hypothetical protein